MAITAALTMAVTIALTTRFMVSIVTVVLMRSNKVLLHSPFDRVHLEIYMFLLIHLKKPCGKNRNNLSDDYTCLGLSLEKPRWGKNMR